MIYAVIDTNVIVASLLTHNHDSATVRVMDAVYSRTIVPLVNDAILAEYADVLHRPNLKLDPVKCAFIVSLMMDVGLYFDPVHSNVPMPDEADRVFYEVTLAGRNGNDVKLVTGNMKHYPKADFIVTPAQFCELLGI